MRRWLPYPLFSLCLLLLWLLLNQSLSGGHLLLGALMGLVGGWTMTSLRPQRVQVRLGWAALKLAGIVVADILRSNFAVARIILLGRAGTEDTSGFILLPLQITNPYGLATLALILTATPGTLWVQHDARRSVLLLHILDLVDEEDWKRLIRHRYERLLLEVFR